MNSEDDINKYDDYRVSYNSKCIQWKSEPVFQRSANDMVCTIIFMLLTIAFLGGGAYFIYDYSHTVNYQGLGQSDDQLLLSEYWTYFGAAILLSIVISFIYIWLLKTFPKIMVQLMIILSLGALGVVVLIGIITGSIGLIIAAGLSLLIYVIILYCFRNKIKVGIVLLRVAAKFLSENMLILLAPILKIISILIISVFWLISLSSILSLQDWHDQLRQDTTIYKLSLFLWFLYYLIIITILYYVMVFTIAVTCAFWYYNVRGNSVCTAYKWICYHFGSFVFAAILISIVTMARAAVQNKRTKNVAVAICLCIVGCLLSCIQRLLEILNNNAIIVMSVTAQSYIQCAKTTIGLLCDNLALLYITRLIASFLNFWIAILGGVIPAGLTYLLLHNAPQDQRALVASMAFMSCLMISMIIGGTISESLSSVFIFYCFDIRFRELGMNSNNMPKEIVDLIDGAKYHKGDHYGRL